LAGAVVPRAGGAVMAFAPVPLLINAVGFPHALRRIIVAAALSAALIAVAGGMAAATAYLVSFGLAAAVMCYMLERRQPFELIVLIATTVILLAGAVVALTFTGSPAMLVQAVRNQLVAGMMRGESFYKTLGIDPAIAPDTRVYVVNTLMQLTPALAGLLSALTVLLNLAVFWRLSGKQQRVGYTLFGDLARWSAPEWLIWSLLVSGFGWFIPLPPLATAALNCFICVLGVYLCQGLAIMAFYFKQLGMPPVARGLIYFVTMAQPVLTALVGAAGVFDLWVDFRRLKSPNVTARNLGNFL
ncbi:MAG: DUF2232 domain-containing protein, partial [Deltaproteobacteria bacterium]|nr:DUF2232 domain-containing protein [Deltaproteobacteria bacterium]